MNNETPEKIESGMPGKADGKAFKAKVSPAVIKRLPRYFRYLRELIRMDKTRISSQELSHMMNVTASQIRQDFNCFGGFGQQGYGYNVEYLYDNICDILGVGAGFTAIVIGAGNLGSALVKSPMFEKRGVEVIAMFDNNPALFGKKIGGVTVYDIKTIDAFCAANKVDIAVLTLTKEHAPEVAARLRDLGIKGFWNFTGKEIDPGKKVVVENVHIGDSLMTLCYAIAKKQAEDEEKLEKHEKNANE